MKKTFSIIVCTSGVRSFLSRTIEGIAVLRIPDGWTGECVIVDNSQHTLDPCLLNNLSTATLPFRVVREPRPGHSRALNTGIDVSHGSLLLLTDDDAVPTSGWVEEYCQAFDNGDIGYLFGPIVSLPESTPPPFWSDLAPRSLAGFDLGPNAKTWTVPCKTADPVGVNMALSRAAFETIGGFDVRLGPAPMTNLPLGGETHLARTLLASAWTAKYVGRAKVIHSIPVERLTYSYLFERKRAVGRCSFAYDPPVLGAKIRRIPISLWWLLLRTSLTLVLCSLRPSGLEFLRARLGLNRVLGVMWAYRHLSRSDYPGIPYSSQQPSNYCRVHRKKEA